MRHIEWNVEREGELRGWFVSEIMSGFQNPGFLPFSSFVSHLFACLVFCCILFILVGCVVCLGVRQDFTV